LIPEDQQKILKMDPESCAQPNGPFDPTCLDGYGIQSEVLSPTPSINNPESSIEYYAPMDSSNVDMSSTAHGNPVSGPSRFISSSSENFDSNFTPWGQYADFMTHPAEESFDSLVHMYSKYNGDSNFNTLSTAIELHQDNSYQHIPSSEATYTPSIVNLTSPSPRTSDSEPLIQEDSGKCILDRR